MHVDLRSSSSSEERSELRPDKSDVYVDECPLSIKNNDVFEVRRVHDQLFHPSTASCSCLSVNTATSDRSRRTSSSRRATRGARWNRVTQFCIFEAATYTKISKWKSQRLRRPWNKTSARTNRRRTRLTSAMSKPSSEECAQIQKNVQRSKRFSTDRADRGSQYSDLDKRSKRQLF